MENAETTVQAAARETWEEACAEVDIHGLYTLINLPHINQVYMIFRAELTGGFSAGPESLEVALFEEHEIPGTSWPSPPSSAPCAISMPTATTVTTRCTSATSPPKIANATLARPEAACRLARRRSGTASLARHSASSFHTSKAGSS